MRGNDATHTQVTGLLKKLDDRIAELEALIQAKEEWGVREIRRRDENVEAGTFEAALAEKAGGEVVRTFQLKGAEAERDELVDLLRRRAALAGEVCCVVLCVFELRVGVCGCVCQCVSVFVSSPPPESLCFLRRCDGAWLDKYSLVVVVFVVAVIISQTLDIGAMYGIKPSELSGNAEHRYKDTSSKGLVVKGQKVAEWKS